MENKFKNKSFTNIKGFTLVELVIVIAVIAILAGVLIPTFSNIIEKANASNDISLVRNINNALELNSSLNELPKDKTELKNVLKEYGINETKNKAKNHIIFWSKSNNMFFIWGIKEERIIFPEYCRNKTLDDFDDEVNMSNNEINNMVEIAKSLIDPNNNGTLYVNKYKDDTILDNKNDRLYSSTGYVTTGAILIKFNESKNLKIYISGVQLLDQGYSRIHIFRESNYSDVTIIYNLCDQTEIDDWGLKVRFISDNYYVIECVDYEKYVQKSKGENVYYALSLYGEGKDLVITHNEEIYR